MITSRCNKRNDTLINAKTMRPTIAKEQSLNTDPHALDGMNRHHLRVKDLARYHRDCLTRIIAIIPMGNNTQEDALASHSARRTANKTQAQLPQSTLNANIWWSFYGGMTFKVVKG